jgi:hypothetical protein
LTARKKTVLFAAIAVGLGAAFVARSQTPSPAADDPLDSLKACPAKQKLILENQFVRVIDDQIPVGVAEPRHRHKHGVTIYLSNYTTEQTTDDGKVTPQVRKIDTAGWNEATIHQVKNIGTTPSHAIRIELKY